MKTAEAAEALATLLLQTSSHMGKSAVALITDMNQPLGTHVGNALEVEESVAALSGRGPDDLVGLSIQLTAHMLAVGEVAGSVGAGEALAREALASGAGLSKFREMVAAQGGDLESLPRASRRHAVSAPRSGFVASIQTEDVGRASMMLGAGRETLDDVIAPGAGLVVHKKLGDEVRAGEALATLHYDDGDRIGEVEEILGDAYEFSDSPPEPRPLIHRILDSRSMAREA